MSRGVVPEQMSVLKYMLRAAHITTLAAANGQSGSSALRLARISDLQPTHSYPLDMHVGTSADDVPELTRRRVKGLQDWL